MEKTELLKALELDKNNDWFGSHQIVQQYTSMEACWIHAYLHRKEGDLSNAGYWYSRARKQIPEYSLDKEWKILFNYLNK